MTRAERFVSHLTIAGAIGLAVVTEPKFASDYLSKFFYSGAALLTGFGLMEYAKVFQRQMMNKRGSQRTLSTEPRRDRMT